MGKSNGTSALSLNSELNQYAAKRANDQKNGLDNHAGFINDPNNPSHAENIGYVSIDTPAKYAKRIFYEMVYNDAASNWGHRDNLANPSYSNLGLGLSKYGDGYLAVAMELN